jgi:hypothetical protein
LRGIPLASRLGNASLSSGKLRFPQRPMLVMFLNNLYDRGCARVWAFRMHSLIEIFDIENVGIISSLCISNGSQARLLFARPGSYWKKQGGALDTAPDSESLSSMTILGEEHH